MHQVIDKGIAIKKENINQLNRAIKRRTVVINKTKNNLGKENKLAMIMESEIIKLNRTIAIEESNLQLGIDMKALLSEHGYDFGGTNSAGLNIGIISLSA